MKNIRTKLVLTIYMIICPFSFAIIAQSAKISTFDFTENPSNAIRKAIKSDYDTIIINKQFKPWVIQPIHFQNIINKVIIIEKGVEIHAINGGFGKSGDCLFKFDSCRNIEIIGNGAQLKMNKKEYTKGEWRHGISIRNCKDIKITDISIEGSGGDGVYISGNSSIKGTYSENISINRLISFNNKRQGLSIISAKNVLINKCVFKETLGTLPGAGIDLEPNNKFDRLESIVFLDCIFEDNDHAGILLALHKLEASSKPISVEFVKCLIRNNHNETNKYVASEIVFGANKVSPVKGSVIFDNCLIENSKWGMFFSRKVAQSYTVTFRDCTARNICKNNTYPAILLEVPDYFEGSYDLGGYVFDNVLIEYETKVPTIMIRGSRINTLKSLSNVSGNLTLKTFNKVDKVAFIQYDPMNNVMVDLQINNIPINQ
ncbi:right-handed parallel beta-helix repeat-containing protein [Zobellia barbeyronii]|uniref:Right-handed parallel beta-helix repeat-containing protein n=1 Tax=Zobellia barbeyronii TaxID=2748009 RepID=A0ABS5WJ44_9FLAO|nr:right-handed parallel beta-helix repeat-containing protein [Zobellia barbeyronii]MBT2163199.1 right-handed parallel beta-helix repeat-containing protein [Zobellia barbeyronii]